MKIYVSAPCAIVRFLIWIRCRKNRISGLLNGRRRTDKSPARRWTVLNLCEQPVVVFEHGLSRLVEVNYRMEQAEYFMVNVKWAPKKAGGKWAE